MKKTIPTYLRSLINIFHLESASPDNPALVCGSTYRLRPENGTGNCWYYLYGHEAALIILDFSFDSEFLFPSTAFGYLFLNYYMRIKNITAYGRDSTWPLSENTIYLHYAPEHDRVVKIMAGSTVKGIMLMVDPDFFSDVINRYTDRVFGLSDLQSTKYVCENSSSGISIIAEQILNCSLTGKSALIRDYFDSKCKELMMLFINTLVCQHDNGPIQCLFGSQNDINRVLVKADDYDRIQKLIQYMQDNLSEEINLTALASFSLMSRRKLTSVFKAVTGFTIQEYRTLLRLRRAQMLLRDKSTSMRVIAKELGFRGPSSFSNFFRQQTGITPSEFRNSFP